jgi:hypothetical protein
VTRAGTTFSLGGMESHLGTKGSLEDPSWQTGQGGTIAKGAAVGTGASTVVETALQLAGTVAGFGPFWIGLQPGSSRRSGEALSALRTVIERDETHKYLRWAQEPY